MVTNWPLSSHLDPISAQQTVLLDQLTLGLRFGRYKGVGIFQERARELQSMGAALTELLADSKTMSDEIKSVLSEVRTVAEQTKAEAEAAAEQKGHAGDDSRRYDCGPFIEPG